MKLAKQMPTYNRNGWVLGQCTACGRLNYVEPHGTTAECRCSPAWTEHRSISYEARDSSGCTVFPGRVPKIHIDEDEQAGR